MAAAAVAAASCLLAACTNTVPGHGSTTAAANAPRKPAAAPPSTPAGTPAAPHVSPISFTSCSSLLNLSAARIPASLMAKLEISCGKLEVPLNYADPNSRQIAIEVLKIHYRANTSVEGSLLTNPGGPGASGIEFALENVASPALANTVLRHYDLIGFDPRGIGLSSPVVCSSDAQKDAINAASPQVLTSAGFAQAKTLAASVARRCATRYGQDLQYYDTVNAARDMDLIRQGVGDDKMNYLGFSYGTELGAQYARLFPDKLRTFVLDGAVDPLTGYIASSAGQLQGFEGAFDQFAANCRTVSPCKSLGDARQAVYQLRDKAMTNPIPTGSSRPLTSNLLMTGVLLALYRQAFWPQLATALIQARNGDGSGLLSLADQYNKRYSDGTYSNETDAYDAITCNDTQPGPSDATIRATAKKWARDYPMFGAWSAPTLFLCQSWQPKRTVPPLPTAKSSAVKILVLGNLHDPATPYQGSKDLVKTLGNAELLSLNGEGHTSYMGGSSCIDNYVDNYLLTQTLPPVNTTCPK